MYIKVNELDYCKMMLKYLALNCEKCFPNITVEIAMQQPKCTNHYTEVPYILIKDEAGNTLLDMVLLYDGHAYDTPIHWCVEAYFHLTDIDIVYWTIEDSSWDDNFKELIDYLETGLNQYLDNFQF